MILNQIGGNSDKEIDNGVLVKLPVAYNSDGSSNEVSGFFKWNTNIKLDSATSYVSQYPIQEYNIIQELSSSGNNLYASTHKFNIDDNNTVSVTDHKMTVPGYHPSSYYKIFYLSKTIFCIWAYYRYSDKYGYLTLYHINEDGSITEMQSTSLFSGRGGTNLKYCYKPSDKSLYLCYEAGTGGTDTQYLKVTFNDDFTSFTTATGSSNVSNAYSISLPCFLDLNTRIACYINTSSASISYNDSGYMVFTYSSATPYQISILDCTGKVNLHFSLSLTTTSLTSTNNNLYSSLSSTYDLTNQITIYTNNRFLLHLNSKYYLATLYQDEGGSYHLKWELQSSISSIPYQITQDLFMTSDGILYKIIDDYFVSIDNAALTNIVYTPTIMDNGLHLTYGKYFYSYGISSDNSTIQGLTTDKKSSSELAKCYILKEE